MRYEHFDLSNLRPLDSESHKLKTRCDMKLIAKKRRGEL